MNEAVEPLALGQREDLAHPGFLDRGPGNEVFTLLDSEVQGHCARLGVDTQENRTGTSIANLLQGRAGIAFDDHCIIARLCRALGDFSERRSTYADNEPLPVGAEIAKRVKSLNLHYSTCPGRHI